MVAGIIAYLRKIIFLKNVWCVFIYKILFLLIFLRNKELFIISNGIMEIDIHEVFLSICEKFQPITHSNKVFFFILNVKFLK